MLETAGMKVTGSRNLGGKKVVDFSDPKGGKFAAGLSACGSGVCRGLEFLGVYETQSAPVSTALINYGVKH